MPWSLFLITFPIAIINGFGAFSQGSFWRGAIGQVITGVLSLLCFGLVGYAFWRFGWKAGLVEILVVFGGANIGLSIYNRLRARL